MTTRDTDQTLPEERAPADGGTARSRLDLVCSLSEGDDDLGLAVLLNSVVRSGFQGRFWIGHRGTVPSWLSQLPCGSDGLYILGQTRLGIEVIPPGVPLADHKPEFLRSLVDRGIATSNLWYFDPNITVRCEWDFFERWITHGVCLCQEINMGIMPADHPLRLQWVKLACAAGWGEPVQWQERYYSSAFVALNARHREFLDVWSRASELAQAAELAQTAERATEHIESRSDPFFILDQDTLNIAAMYSAAPQTAIGPEGMGWVTGGFTMYHSGTAQPWRKRFLRSALLGNPPSNAEKHFLDSAEGPLLPFAPAKLKRMRLAAHLASLIGRFNRRY